jgi:translation initiation factor IF-3
LIFNDQQLGIVALSEALQKAQESNLDLVEIAPQAKPPVCKILDYSHYRYQKQKAEKQARKHQKKIEVQEVKFSPVIAEHDYNVKLNHIVKFLEAGKQVKVSVLFRGRQNAHKDLGEELLNKVIEQVKHLAESSAISSSTAKSLTIRLVPYKE